MDNQQLTLDFYKIKRSYLFCDEWLFYALLLTLFLNNYYLIFVFVLPLGFRCLHISYHNLDLVEKKIIDIEQRVSPFDEIPMVFNYFKDIWDNITVRS